MFGISDRKINLEFIPAYLLVQFFQHHYMDHGKSIVVDLLHIR